MTKQSNHFYDINLGRRRLIQGAAVLPVAGLGGLAFAQQFPTAKVNTTKLAVTDTEVVVGQLHSASGTMAISETGSIQAEQLAIDQINAAGGIDALEWDSARSHHGAAARDWLRTKANSIEGGTSEVMLGIVAKRILDLPGA